MIELNNVSFTYGYGDDHDDDHHDGSGTPILNDVSLKVEAGECLLLCGKSGCGKSTILNLINGIIPNHIEGRLEGSVKVDGIVPQEVSIQALSAVVGSVFQNPKSQFFSLNSTDELLFGCCNHKVPRETMLTRLEETVSDFNIAHLQNRPIFDLSGGEKQKLACASVYMIRPKIYLLDEPSANLDAVAIEELKRVIATLKAAGNTILIAEHRLYYLIELCDLFVYIDDGRVAGEFTAAEFVAIGEEERKGMGLRATAQPSLAKGGDGPAADAPSVTLQGLHCFHGRRLVVDIDQLQLPKHRVIALVGNNGAGKSTLAAGLCGILKTKGGVIDDKTLTRQERLRRFYMVMQDVNHQLFAESVLDELMLNYDIDDAEKTAEAEGLLAELNLLPLRDEHPHRLSGGQKQRTSIGTALFMQKRYLIFDEPTSGVDLIHMTRIARLIESIKERVELILVITHDREFINACCDDVIELADGKIVDRFSIGR